MLHATLGLADMISDSDEANKHCDHCLSQIWKSESCLQRAMEAVKSFMNPFHVADKTELYDLSSGTRLPHEIQKDVMQAPDIGKQEKEKFIKDRLEKRADLFEPIKKLKLKTMIDTKKTIKLKISRQKVI